MCACDPAEPSDVEDEQPSTVLPGSQSKLLQPAVFPATITRAIDPATGADLLALVTEREVEIEFTRDWVGRAITAPGGQWLVRPVDPAHPSPQVGTYTDGLTETSDLDYQVPIEVCTSCFEAILPLWEDGEKRVLSIVSVSVPGQVVSGDLYWNRELNFRGVSFRGGERLEISGTIKAL